MLSIAREIQIPYMFTALRMSYTVKTNATQRKQAASLAHNITEIRPAVYQVGRSIVDLWRGFCTCQQYRSTRSKTCPHYLALYLAGKYCPADSTNPTAYLVNLGVQRPAILAVYARVKISCYDVTKSFTARISKTDQPGLFMAVLPNGLTAFVKTADISNRYPFYE